MTTQKQPSAGAVKLATELNGSSHAHIGDAAIIDRHVAPLVGCLENLILAMPHDDQSNKIALHAHAALKQWKDGAK